MIKFIRSVYIKVLGLKFDRNIDIIIHPSASDKEKEVMRRVDFFLHNYKFNYRVKYKDNLPKVIFTPTFAVGFSDTDFHEKAFRGYFYNIDYDKNPLEAWEYHFLLTFINKKIDYNSYKQKLKSFYDKCQDEFNYDKAYMFGTGPSLEKAIDRKWGDGFRIVCNTIVKDKELWTHLQPHVITAGDAIYHYGIGKFAMNFRRDLKQRLNETSAIFIYPDIFHAFCVREFAGLENRLFPVPQSQYSAINYNLFADYHLPKLPNVLVFLLLPISCTFSKTVYMWGFDGRAPKDKDFWKNSDKQFYQDDVPELKKLHPAFYDKQIPKNDEESYVKRVHGDDLDNALTEAEEKGYKFVMMHHTYTPVLAKRMQ